MIVLLPALKIEPIPKFLRLNYPVKKPTAISFNWHNTKNTTVKGCFAWHIRYNCNFSDGAVLCNQKISILNLNVPCFFPAFHWNVNAILPIDTTVCKVNTCNKVCTFILVFIRRQALPTDADLLGWPCILFF